MDPPVDFLSPDSVTPEAVDGLLDLCFGPARHRRTAALLRLGAPQIERACFVALDGEQLVGSVAVHQLQWRHPKATRPIALVGPLVSHPQRRGERIGARLLDLALGETDRLGLPVMLIGDAPYYQRWRFSARYTGEWILPGPVDRDRLLLRAADARRLAGPAILGAQAGAIRAA